MILRRFINENPSSPSIEDSFNNYKTLLSNVNSPQFSSAFTPEINSDESLSNFGKTISDKVPSFDEGQILGNFINGLNSALSGTNSIKFDINNSKIKGKRGTGNIIKDLINLILGIIKLPIRFGYLFKSGIEASGALALGIGGLSQSIALGTKDLYILLITIIKIIIKYFSCILSFTITTIGGCALIHPVTLFFVMIYLFVVFILDIIKEKTQIDLTSSFDSMVEKVQWPSFIQMFCYSCFGKKVKLRDLLADVGVIQEIGKTISNDFNNVMPRYMKPSAPLGKSSIKSLDKALN
jgi:hypothetical protein